MLPVAIPKSLLSSTLAMHVEVIWIREDFLVPVGRLVGINNAFAGFDTLWRNLSAIGAPNMIGLGMYLPSERDVHLCDKTERHGRCSVEPSELFDKGFRQGRVSFGIFELVGMLQESDSPLMTRVSVSHELRL